MFNRPTFGVHFTSLRGRNFPARQRSRSRTRKKKARDLSRAPMGGDYLLSHTLDAVPSAPAGLTSLFGMGRGDPRRFRHLVSPRYPKNGMRLPLQRAH